MPFTPNAFSVGDFVVVDRPESNERGTFSAGTEFQIIDIVEKHGTRYYDLRDHEQNLLFGVPASDLRPSSIERP